MYNDNRLNYEDNNINQMNFIGHYSNNKRSISPKLINNQRIDKYYYNEGNPNMSNKNINIKEKLLNPEYRNYTNPPNYIHQQNLQYPEYIPPYNNSSNNYHPNQFQQNIYYDQIMPTSNKCIYTNGNMNYNYFPQIMSKNNNNKQIKNDSVEKNKSGVKLNILNYETQYPMTFFSEKPINKKKTFIQNYNNNINNYIVNTKEPDDYYSKATEKSMTTKNYNLHKKNNFNSIIEESAKIPKKKKSKNREKNKDNDYNSEELNNNGQYFHKKKKTKIDYNDNDNDNDNEDNNINRFNEIQYEKKDDNLNYKKINANNNYKNKYKYNDTRGRLEYEDGRNKNENENYKHSKYNLSNKLHGKKKINKNHINEYEKQEKYNNKKIKKFINHLEQYYILAFHNYFDYLLDRLILWGKMKEENNKNNLLKRLQRVNNRYTNNNEKIISNNNIINDGFNKVLRTNYSYQNFKRKSNNNYGNNLRKVYIPKKNIEYIEYNKNNLNNNGNNNNLNLNRNNYSQQKNKSHDYNPYTSSFNRNDINYRDNRFNSIHDNDNNSENNFNIKRNNFEKSVDTINDRNNYSLYSNNNININKSHENLLPYKYSPYLSSFHKRINENMIYNKKSIIYVKPKANKLNIKKEIIYKEKENDLNSLNDINSNYSNTIQNQTFKNNTKYIYSNIFNSKKPLNDNNIVYNSQNNQITSFSTKNINKKVTPTKPKPKYKNHARNISDLAKEIIDNANFNLSQKNKMKKKENDFFSNSDENNNDNEINNFEISENENGNINETIGNDDLIEETIIKDICTYDKKLWVFIKYVISPKAKQNFLKMKIKRLKLMKDSKNIFINKELNSLQLMQTDSIELISNLSKYNSYNKYSFYSNDKMMKEISEEKESFIQDDDFNSKMSNMIGILEDLKKQYISYFYNYFFNLINSISNNGNNIEKKSNNANNIFKNGNENGYKINEVNEKENLKRNLYPEYEENYNNSQKAIKEKFYKNNNNKNQDKEMKKQNKLKNILMNKLNNIKRYYLTKWKKKCNNNINDNKDRESSEKKNSEEKELDEGKKEFNKKNKEQKLNRNNLISFPLKNNKKKDKHIIINENEEEIEYEKEEEDEGVEKKEM